MTSTSPQSKQKASTTKRVTRLLLLLLLIGVGLWLMKPEAAVVVEETIVSVVVPPLASLATPVMRIELPAAHADTILVLSASSSLSIPQGAFVDAAGEEVTEAVVIEYREFMTPIETYFSGIPMALDSNRVLKSAGMVEMYGTTASGAPLSIREDRALGLEFASVDRDEGYTAWALDTVSGSWSEVPLETELVESSELEELQALEDRIPPPPREATSYSFSIGDDTGGQPELAEFEHIFFEPVNGEPCGFTATQIDVFPRAKGVYDVRFIGHEYGYKNIAREETCSCYLAFEKGESYSQALKQYQKKNRKMLAKREREKERIQRAWDRHLRALTKQQMLLEEGSQAWRQRSAEKRVMRTLEVLAFGVLNIDKPFAIDAPVQLMATFENAQGAPLELTNLKIIDMDSRVLYPCASKRVPFNPNQRQLLIGVTADQQLAYVDIRALSGISGDLESFTFPMTVVPQEELTVDAITDILIPPA